MAQPARDYTDPAVTPKAAPLPKLPADQPQQGQGVPYDQSRLLAQRAATAAALKRVIENHPDIAGSR